MEESAGPEQLGAYIFRDDGDLAWSGVRYLGGWAADFGSTVIDGKLVFHAFQGALDQSHGRIYGDHDVLAQDYETESCEGSIAPLGILSRV